MMIYEGVAFLPNSKSQTEEDSFEYSYTIYETYNLLSRIINFTPRIYHKIFLLLSLICTFCFNS